jgi:TusA-related sulfurtransferase
MRDDGHLATPTGSRSPTDETRAIDSWRPAEEFVNALAAGDYARLQACLSPQVRFRALIPSGLREREGARDTAALIRTWFEGVGRLEILETGVKPIAHRAHLWYRLREFYPDGESEVIEQNAFCEVEGGQISAMDLVCSGHLPEPGKATSSVRQFDAGDLGCGSGLPQEFRRQIEAQPMGGVLKVRVRDPSAREDLPSLARLLGHEVLSVTTSVDGSATVSVRRGR